MQYVHCVQNTNMCVICASVQGSLFAYRLHFCTWPQGFCVGHVSEYWLYLIEERVFRVKITPSNEGILRCLFLSKF